MPIDRGPSNTQGFCGINVALFKMIDRFHCCDRLRGEKRLSARGYRWCLACIAKQVVHAPNQTPYRLTNLLG